jgi:outer membrane receptor protein involved in Fe transport
MVVLAGGLSAHAQAPKAPQLKPPEVKVPEVKAPEVPAPEGKASGGEESGTAGFELPPELMGGSVPVQGVPVEQLGVRAPPTMEELVNPKVSTVSHRVEEALNAPAWILTFSAEELRARGYQELSDLLDDLPGMDVIRTWGAPYFRSYWRGYRKHEDGDFFVQGEEPFLLLVDGMDFKHLGLGQAQSMAAIPLSNVERVEVVYGPASALYGPNASMGVINVLTRRPDAEGGGAGARARVSVRSPQQVLTRKETVVGNRLRDMSKQADFSALYKGEGFRVSVSGRFEIGVLDPSVGERFEWLKGRYFSELPFWSGLSSVAAMKGGFHSPNEKQAVDARLVLERRSDEGVVTGETEVAAQLYRMYTGRGLLFPADFIHSNSPYVLVEQSLSVRHTQELSDALDSTTLLRYRRSNVDGTTALFMAEPFPNESLGFFVYLRNANSSLGFSQRFNLKAGSSLFLEGDALHLGFGLQYERRDLGDYDFSDFGSWEGDAVESPLPLGDVDRLEMRTPVDVAGTYLLSKYSFLADHDLHLGLRLDFNTAFGRLEPTFRGGYVGRYFDRLLTVKLFYGQAIAEPGTRDLRLPGSRGGSGDADDANPLSAERSQTVEAGLDYRLEEWLALHGTAYYVHYNGFKDALDTVTQESLILPYQGRMAGVDVGAVAVLDLAGSRQLRAWAYYSPYLLARQSNPAAPEELIDTGDLARHKVLLGATLELNSFLSVTGLGRCLSARRTIVSNPLQEIPGYCVVDANLLVRNLFVEGLSLSLRGSNVLDTQYAHPGLYEASSGDFPGRWEGQRWIGSSESSCPQTGTTCSIPFNSQMPQPGRAFSLQLGLEM